MDDEKLTMERKQAEKSLTECEGRYRQLLSSVTDYVFTVQVEHGRPAATTHGSGCAAVTGYTSEEYAADPYLWYRMVHEEDRQTVMREAESVLSGKSVQPFEHRIIHKDERIRWIKNTLVPHFDQQGRLVSYDGLVTDITERKRAEQELLRVNKALKAFSGCSQAMVRAAEEPELLRFVCRIIIEAGEYRMCWVGYAEHDDAKAIRPVAHAGHEEGYLKATASTWSDTPLGSGPAGAAVRTGKPAIFKDAANDCNFAPWCREALKRGYASAVGFPLVNGTETFGTLVIYASEADAFDDEEVKHLKELADSLAYGVIALRTRREHRNAELALRESEEKLKQEFANVARAKKEWEVTFDAISDPVFIYDREGRIIRANRAYTEAAGMTFHEIIGKPYHEVFPRTSASSAIPGNLREAQGREDEQSSDEIFVSALNRIFKPRVYPVLHDGDNYFYSVQILEDITEMKRAEENMRQEMEITSSLLMLAETTTYTMAIDDLMEHVVRCSAKIMGSDASLSYLWDKERKVFQPSRHYGLSHESTPVFNTESVDKRTEFVRMAMRIKSPVIVNETAGEPPQFVAEPFMDGVRKRGRPSVTRLASWMSGTKTLIAIPLFGNTDPLGLIIVVYGKKKAFTGRDQKIVKGISREVSLVLEEAHLYRTAMERTLELAHKMETLQVIHQIDRSILSSLEPQEILGTTIRNIGRVIPCDKAEITLVDSARQGFISAARWDVRSSPEQIFTPFQDTSAYDVVKTGRTQYVTELKMQGNLLPLEKALLKEGFASHIRVPLVVKREVVGVLCVASRRTGAFTPESLSTLEKLAALTGVALENTRLVTDLQELFIGTVKSLSSAIDAKSTWTAGHSQRVTRYALLIGREMGFSETMLKDLELAGLLHDIGKIATYDNILDKPTGLTASEYEIVKKHSQRGAELLMPIKQLNAVIPWIRHHHERFDGCGYPDGLKEDEIPLMARVLAVVDSFDSMTVERPYRMKLEREMAIQELKRCSGTQFDPKVVDVFLKILHETNRTQVLDITGGFPPGQDDPAIGASKTPAGRNGACNKRTRSDA